jgi:energy-coupling factor transport system permease protein
MLLGLLGILFGLAGLLGVFSQSNIGTLTLLIGISLSFFALWLAGKNASRTNYRPDKWHIPEVLVITSAFFGLVAMRFTESIVLNPVTSPISFPQINFITLVSIWVAVLAIPLSPKPPFSNRAVSDLFRTNTQLQRNAA